MDSEHLNKEQILMRISKNEYYINIASSVAQRGTCRIRNYGAVIVKDDHIVSTGYTGSPRGIYNCNDTEGFCLRELGKVPAGKDYSTCISVHAEMNAIIHASYEDMISSVLYLSCVLGPHGKEIKNISPCYLCRRMILNTGITKVITLNRSGQICETTRKMLIDSEVI